MPNLSTIHDRVKILQTEANPASKETATALAIMKEEVHDGRIKIEENIAATEEVKRIAKETAEVSKTAVSIAREVGNKDYSQVRALHRATQL